MFRSCGRTSRPRPRHRPRTVRENGIEFRAPLLLLVLLLAFVGAGACGAEEKTKATPSPAQSPFASSSPSSSPPPPPSPPQFQRSPLPPPAGYSSASEAANAIAESETAIRSEAGAASAERLGRIQQLAYRTLVNNSGWRDPALKALPDNLRPIAQAHVAAGAKLRALTKPVEKLPAWRIVAPPPAEELRSFYSQAEVEFGVSWTYLAAIHLVETRMGRIRGTSPAGAQGPMQFMPATWDRYGQGDVNNPRDAIFAAARYLKANGAPGDMRRALYRYNPSYNYVDAIETYAGQLKADARVYLAYYNWQVYVRTTSGDVLLEVGYGG